MNPNTTTPRSLLHRAAEHRAMAWKNGGGTTRELAVFPPNAGLQDFIWRASLADVAVDGPFSRFDGIDRILVLLEGAGMTLAFERHIDVRLSQPYQSLSFAGESEVTALLHAGPTRDLNLMTRRDRVRGSVQTVRGPTLYACDPEVALLFCAAGRAALGWQGQSAGVLYAGDLLQIAPEEAGAWQAEIAGAAVLIALRITPVPESGVAP